MTKHYVSSVFCFYKTETEWQLLLVDHKRLGSWVVPGGHVTSDENPMEAALREVREEVGLRPRLVSFLHYPLQNLESEWLVPPEYFLEHKVPAFGKEPAHLHIDCIYVGIASTPEIAFDPKELYGAGWFSALQVQSHPNVFASTQKIAHILLTKLNMQHSFAYK